MKNVKVRNYIRNAPLTEFYEVTAELNFQLYSCIICPKQYAIGNGDIYKYGQVLRNHTILNHLTDVKLILD